jgi:DNA-binding MarR family transcriptional regulator
MTDVQDIPKRAWQVEAVKDDLQPAIDTYVVLRRTADAVSRYVESELNEWGVTTAQYGVLLHLMRGEPLSLTDLSGLVFRSNSTLTSLIDRMERDGLVARADHARDRRVTTVELTSKGRELLQTIRTHHRPFLANMMSCLSNTELAQLRELLQKIEDQLEGENCSQEASSESSPAI